MRPLLRPDQIAATLEAYGVPGAEVLGAVRTGTSWYVNTRERSYRVPAEVLGIDAPAPPPERRGLLFTHPEV